MRQTIRAVIERHAEKRYARTVTPILWVTHVRDAQGACLCERTWLPLLKAFAALDLAPGDVVTFDAEVIVMLPRRGMMFYSWDHQPICFRRPTRVRKL